MATPRQETKAPSRLMALSEMVRGWWPDLTRRCPYGFCGGRLVVVYPALERGRVECLSCSREVAEVTWTPTAASRPVLSGPLCVECDEPSLSVFRGGRCSPCYHRQYDRERKRKAKVS